MDVLILVIDFELGVDVVNLGLINSVDFKDDGICDFLMILMMMGCFLQGILCWEVIQVLVMVLEVYYVNIDLVWELVWMVVWMSCQVWLFLGIY